MVPSEAAAGNLARTASRLGRRRGLPSLPPGIMDTVPREVDR